MNLPLLTRHDPLHGNLFASPFYAGYLIMHPDLVPLFVGIGLGDDLAQLGKHLGEDAEHEGRGLVLLAVKIVLEHGAALDLVCEAGLRLSQLAQRDGLVFVRRFQMRDRHMLQQEVERRLRAAIAEPVGEFIRAHRDPSGQWSVYDREQQYALPAYVSGMPEAGR